MFHFGQVGIHDRFAPALGIPAVGGDGAVKGRHGPGDLLQNVDQSDGVHMRPEKQRLNSLAFPVFFANGIQSATLLVRQPVLTYRDVYPQFMTGAAKGVTFKYVFDRFGGMAYNKDNQMMV